MRPILVPYQTKNIVILRLVLNHIFFVFPAAERDLS